MILSDLSIRRPVFALVVSLLLLIFGLVAFSRLPVREMPDVQSPSVSIVTTYEGAAPEIVENQVSKPLEDQLSGISGIRTIYSTSRKGRSSITIEFQQGWNMLEALSDIRDAVARARNQLPDEIDEPVVARDNGEGEVAIWLNFASRQLDRVALTDYANRHLPKSLSLVNGVSSVNLSGDLQRVMYVRLDPTRMSGLNIAVNDVLDALARENVELPGGEIRNDSMVFPVQLQRPYQDAASFRRLPVRTLSGGQTIYLGDVADVEVGAKNELSAYQLNGQVSIGIGIIPQSTANPLEMADGVTREVARLQRFLPAGAELVVDYNSTLFIRQAIDEVYLT
ncbi:MAG: efflux RND transporter permease subunit, partial [Aeromonadaceae bacterium]